MRFFFRERENFSLESWEVRPSVVVGTRRKAALRGEAYAWVPDLRILDKLCEVGDSPYLGFTLCFRGFSALNGHLIDPKTWDRSVRNYGTHFGQSVNRYGLFGCNV